MKAPTRPPVGICRIVVSRFADGAVGIPGTAMRPDAIVLSHGPRGEGFKRSIGEIQAPVSGKFDICYLANLQEDGVNAGNSLLPRHRRPSLAQLHT